MRENSTGEATGFQRQVNNRVSGKAAAWIARKGHRCGGCIYGFPRATSFFPLPLPPRIRRHAVPRTFQKAECLKPVARSSA
jgi:hypothetical protein